MRAAAPYRLLALVLIAAPLAGRAETPIPFLSGRVNDTADMLSAGTIHDLDVLLKAHEDSTSNQVVVLTIPALQDGEEIEQFSIRVADAWKIGQKGRDNGVLLIVSRDDHKVRIEVGRGLEGALPDITCGSIIRHEIIPRFKAGDFDGGVTSGVKSILAAIRGEYTALPEESTGTDLGILGYILFGLFLLATLGTFTFFSIASPGCMGWFLYAFLIPFWAVFPSAIYGITPGMILLGGYLLLVPVARLVLPKTAVGKKLSVSFAPSSRSGSGGWSSWSSSSSGGSSGFSGGGGGFSGGGASGSW